jgi:hypothetical protein
MSNLLNETQNLQTTLSEMRRLRKLINPKTIRELYTTSYDIMYPWYHMMPPKQAEKFIEGWVATQIGGQKITSSQVEEEYKKNDNGDIWAGEKLIIGKNNIELKCIFKDGSNIGGGQFRFYENVPYYMFFKAWNETRHEVFLLTKEQLISEIIERARDSKYSAYGSSQGSGVINKLTQDEKIQRLYDNVEGKYADKIGWGFNTDTEIDLYKKFQNKYLINLDDVKNKINAI